MFTSITCYEFSNHHIETNSMQFRQQTPRIILMIICTLPRQRKIMFAHNMLQTMAEELQTIPPASPCAAHTITFHLLCNSSKSDSKIIQGKERGKNETVLLSDEKL